MMIGLLWSILHMHPILCNKPLKPGENCVISHGATTRPGSPATTPIP